MSTIKSNTRLSISVRRANGRVDNLGVIRGGAWWQHLFTRIRIAVANWRTRRGGK